MNADVRAALDQRMQRLRAGLPLDEVDRLWRHDAWAAGLPVYPDPPPPRDLAWVARIMRRYVLAIERLTDRISAEMRAGVDEPIDWRPVTRWREKETEE